MQGTYGYIEYIGEKKVRNYSCRNCHYYGEGVCNARKIALNYSEHNGRICSYFDPINKFNKKSKTKDKNVTTSKGVIKHSKSVKKYGQTEKRVHISNNKVIDDIQIARSQTKNAKKNGNKFVTSRSKVYINSVKHYNTKKIIDMSDKRTDSELFNRLLDKPIDSTILYKDVIYKITNIINAIVK